MSKMKISIKNHFFLLKEVVPAPQPFTASSSKSISAPSAQQKKALVNQKLDFQIGQEVLALIASKQSLSTSTQWEDKISKMINSAVDNLRKDIMKTCTFLTTNLIRWQTEMVASLTSVTNNKLHDIKEEMTIFKDQLEDICTDVSTMK